MYACTHKHTNKETDEKGYWTMTGNFTDTISKTRLWFLQN